LNSLPLGALFVIEMNANSRSGVEPVRTSMIRPGSLVVAQLEVRQVIAHPVVEPEPALVGQAQQRGGRECLAGRTELEQRRLVDGQRVLDAGHAVIGELRASVEEHGDRDTRDIERPRRLGGDGMQRLSHRDRPFDRACRSVSRSSISAASNAARSGSAATTTCSSAACAPPPTAPSPSLDGVAPLGAGESAYAASKFAVEGACEVLATELGHLGIRVTIVEPGPVRTEFGAGAVAKPVTIDDYEESVGKALTWFENLAGNQPNDPRRVAQAVLDMLDADEPPLRLALGVEAVEGIRAKLDRQRRELDAWEPVSTATRFRDS
jgi:hypothetical protein